MFKPIATTMHKDMQSTVLVFPEGSKVPSGRFCIRGGICFPVSTTTGIRGHVVVCGLHIESKVVYVLAESQFVTIEHVLREKDGGIDVRFKGLVAFVNKAWTRYFSRIYYFQQSYEARRKYMLQVHRSAMIKPKPQFVEVPWTSDVSPMMSVYELDNMERLRYSRESIVCEEMKQHNAEPDAVYPALHSLICAVNGLERFPLRANNGENMFDKPI